MTCQYNLTRVNEWLPLWEFSVHLRYLFALSFSGFILSTVSAANFEIPTLSTYLWKGKDSAHGQPCFVTIRSNNAGLISYLAYEGEFRAWARSLPNGLSASEEGLTGIVSFLRDLTPEAFRYETSNSLAPGLILRSFPLDEQGQFREAVLSGSSLLNLESLDLRIQSPELSLDASCTQLARQRVD